MAGISVVNFVTLDGVIQSPLSPDEDREGWFDAGGWVEPFMDEVVARVMGETTTSAAGFTLGRKTFELFAASWSGADQAEPAVAALNQRPKYVVSGTLSTVGWANSRVLGPDLATEVSTLRRQAGGDLVVFGSGELVASLLAEDLIDRLTLIVFPVLLGDGKRMWPRGSDPLHLQLVQAEPCPRGAVVLRYSLHPTGR